MASARGKLATSTRSSAVIRRQETPRDLAASCGGASVSTFEQENSAVDQYTVIVNGRIVGRDPDPNVRLMLTRDPVADAP